MEDKKFINCFQRFDFSYFDRSINGPMKFLGSRPEETSRIMSDPDPDGLHNRREL
jgi:hypothetical protein